MITHSSILAWEIPWTEETGGSWVCKRVSHDLATKVQSHWFPCYPRTWLDMLPHLGFCTSCFLSFRVSLPQIIQRICFLSLLTFMKPYCEVFSNILTHFVSYYFLPSPCLVPHPWLLYMTSSVFSYLYIVCFSLLPLSLNGNFPGGICTFFVLITVLPHTLSSVTCI